jgi:hypothetical protein
MTWFSAHIFIFGLLAQAAFPPGGGGYNVISAAISKGAGIVCEASGRDDFGRVWYIGVSPASYLVTDIGRKGVPTLHQDDLRMLHKIQRYIHSKVLRFISISGHPLFFNAVAGPCIGGAPGYPVLNGYCNEYYMPSGEFTGTHSVPGCMTPRPWMPSESGKPGNEAWKYPSGSR